MNAVEKALPGLAMIWANVGSAASMLDTRGLEATARLLGFQPSSKIGKPRRCSPRCSSTHQTWALSGAPIAPMHGLQEPARGDDRENAYAVLSSPTCPWGADDFDLAAMHSQIPTLCTPVLEVIE